MGSQIIRRFQNMFEIFEVNKNGTRDTVEKKLSISTIALHILVEKVLWGADFLPRRRGEVVSGTVHRDSPTG